MVADIHANVEAFEAVLRKFDAANVDHVVCLGDTVGYHASPNECVRLVRDHCETAIAGNHDRAALGTIGVSEFGFLARRAVSWTAAHLALDCADFLRGLAIEASLDATTHVVHAGLHPEPNDRFHVSTPARIGDNLAAIDARGVRVCFFGHTHRPAIHSTSGTTTDASVELDPDSHYLINPGSVGQPRDRDARAAYAVYDSGAHRVELLRAEYDEASCRSRATAAGLLDPPSLARRSLEAMRSRWIDTTELARRAWGRP